MKIAPDNNQWFKQFVAGNELAFKYYFDQYHQTLFYISYKIVREVETAEDIVADSFQKLWEYREKIRSENHMAGFLRLVARNMSLNYKKHEGRKLASEEELRYLTDDLENTDLARDLIEAELIKNLHKAVEQLPKMCKAVFKLLYFEQMSTREVAGQLGISERNVLNQKARAISLLRGIFSG
jgi:RNA polymerase sigma-70 factor (ECF subfamily)